MPPKILEHPDMLTWMFVLTELILNPLALAHKRHTFTIYIVVKSAKTLSYTCM